MQSEGKLYLIFEFVDRDLKKYMESTQGMLDPMLVKVRSVGGIQACREMRERQRERNDGHVVFWCWRRLSWLWLKGEKYHAQLRQQHHRRAESKLPKVLYVENRATSRHDRTDPPAVVS